jgi:hypothetical protein
MLKDSLWRLILKRTCEDLASRVPVRYGKGNHGLSGDICIYTGIWRRTRSEEIKDNRAGGESKLGVLRTE